LFELVFALPIHLPTTTSYSQVLVLLQLRLSLVQVNLILPTNRPIFVM